MDTAHLPDAPRLLHVYAPYAPHDSAHLVGTRDALQHLHTLLTALLEGPPSARDLEVFTRDGAGCVLDVRLVQADQMPQYALPYTAPELREDGGLYRYWPETRDC